ncbi:MAG: hypothetical protein KIT84_26525 [Labilithrix sp.]|nr:hypothetical protein [Labilithrix sp.]MCW5814609.1 hypothetical protein [Labilithrix sp.]
MAQPFVAEEHHVEEVREHLEDYVGLEHVRVQRRDDLLVFESGPNEDAVPHTRFRRIGDHRWQIEVPLKDGGWDRLPLSIQLIEAVDIVISEFPWTLAPRERPKSPPPDGS